MLTLAAVGRGGQGDVGQRIRDEILYVQSRNNAKVTNFDNWFVDDAPDEQTFSPNLQYRHVAFCAKHGCSIRHCFRKAAENT